MRKIAIVEPQSQAWQDWRSDCNDEAAKLPDPVDPAKAVEFKEHLYRRKSIKESYFFTKEEPFYGRCAYCEMPIRDFLNGGDVEHFRPKGGIANADDTPILWRDDQGLPILDAQSRVQHHPGYFWLAYDWRNLLPSCRGCNQPFKPGEKKLGKHNRFPVEGRHAQQRHEVATERPLLIHPADPEDDDPEDHLGVDTRSGAFFGKSGSPRGKACIEVLDLNDRDQLLPARLDAIARVLLLVSQIILTPGGSPAALAELMAMKRGSEPHTLARRAKLSEISAQLGPVF
jgi:hypothetical protein